MGICYHCGQEMMNPVGCTAYPGRIPLDESEADADGLCHDCSVPVGALHHAFCDMEVC